MIIFQREENPFNVCPIRFAKSNKVGCIIVLHDALLDDLVRDVLIIMKSIHSVSLLDNLVTTNTKLNF